MLRHSHFLDEGMAGEMRNNPKRLFCLYLLYSTSMLWAYPMTPPQDRDVTPRITVLSKDLKGCRHFRGSALNYSTLLLEEEAGVLYVGARGALYSLQAFNISGPSHTINWEAREDQKELCARKGKDNLTECFNHIRFLQRFNSTHLYTCGTHAFNPLCAYINAGEFKISSAYEEGRERCPYDPAKGYTGLLVDGQMYTASQYEFWSSPDIRRNSPNPTLKTEEAPTRWLYEADFVGSTLLKESVNSLLGDDDKIYFFFTEKSQDQSPYFKHSRVARVARVCKSDRGGRLTLQKKWTSFLKAQLVCSLPEYEFHFNVLRSIFVLKGATVEDTMFYGIFGLEWKNVKSSAICRYTITDVQQAFNGPYVENQEDSSGKWSEYTGKVPDPRPGSCITDHLRTRGMNFSTDLPDEVLHFVRRHPLMSQQILPLGQRPLLFKRTVDYTKIVVQKVTALDDQTYHMLYIGTDEGWLQKAVEVKGHLHIIEELQLFEKPQPVESIVLSQKQMSIYVGASSGVVQVPLFTCHKYASCFDCVLARDPFCAWDGRQCVEIASRTDRSNLTQDILNGKEGCEKSAADGPVFPVPRSVIAGDDVLLQCDLGSNLATPQWTYNEKELQGYGLSSGYRIGTDGLLVIKAQVNQSGNYSCYALENGIRVHVLRYHLIVRTSSDGNPTETSNFPPAPLPPDSRVQKFKNLEVIYLSVITILGGLCLVLTTVLLYVGFCVQSKRGKYSVRAASQATQKSGNSQMELRTISSHCNGKGDAHDGFLQIVPGEAQLDANKELPPAPPLPPGLIESEFTNGFPATLPNVLRKINGNSYVLLRQTDGDPTSPLYYSFTDELNRILEKRKHTQLCSKPDESSV